MTSYIGSANGSDFILLVSTVTCTILERCGTRWLQVGIATSRSLTLQSTLCLSLLASNVGYACYLIGMKMRYICSRLLPHSGLSAADNANERSGLTP